MQAPDICSMEPENYKKYFRTLYWSSPRKHDRKQKHKPGKKEKLRRLKAANNLAICNAPSLLANPSQFAVYATVRRTVLTRWKLLNSLTIDYSDDSDNDDHCNQTVIAKLPKITGVGLKTVFALISQARFTDADFCEHALRALLDVLQGHAPEELNQEPSEIISTLHAMLVEVASGSGPSGKIDAPTNLTALSSSCLIALSVARGEAELILNAIASLIMSHTSLSNQSVQIPANLLTLQRSVQSYILGTPSRNLWLNFGVPNQSLVTSFPVDLPAQLTSGHSDLIVRSLASDGCFLYVYTSKGLLKIGSGYGSSIRQHVYLYKPDFFSSDRHGWLGYCKNKLYVRIGRKKTEIYEVDKETLEVRNIVKLDPGQPAPIEPKSTIFTDGNLLGMILITNHESLTIRMYDVDSIPERTDGVVTLKSHKELNVHLLRRRTLVLGRAPFEDNLARRPVELDVPVAMQLDDCDDDPLMSICSGQEFGLLTTGSGKVYYTGKGSSLGYKVASPQCGRWILMKETIFNRNDASNTKKCKVVQLALGHEGVHAILVLDNGTALFTGVARRGEDGDNSKHRRTPKPTRPKKMTRAEGHTIVYAACNYGSTALVTKSGQLLMFGKDTQHCDSGGVVTALKAERVVQVALGKAHAVALTNFGQVFTFGINNKNQCGREFGYTKEKSYMMRRASNKEESRLCAPTQHVWVFDYCRVCVLCRECTGFSSACQCADFPNRVPKEKCGCGEGDSGCSVCGVCRRCADAASDPPASSSDSNAAVADKDNPRYAPYECGPLDPERDTGSKMSCLPPARVAVPGGHRIAAVACGLHHTVLMTEHGEVLTFGSNQCGQLGAGDISAHHRIVKVRVPRASSIAAGSNHTAILTREGELYTFGSYQKGSLGRPRIEESSRADRSPIWYATPGRVPRLGPRHACKAVWVSACGDQTFVQVSQALIKTDTLFSSTITCNSSAIIILPNRPEHTFKCVTINKSDGTCNAWTGPEQVDFVNSLACLDPLYDLLWCYQPQMRVMKCFNILAFDSHKLQRCCANETDDGMYATETEFEYPNYGSMKRMEDFKNLENIEAICNTEEKKLDGVALTNMSVLNQELAIPCVSECTVTRMHAALHLLGCLDSLTTCHDTRAAPAECKRDSAISPVLPCKEEFLTVNRFESHGGGWGYSGHSVEAIRFMCDMDILLGGFGLFGGRGDYSAKIKLFDIGPEGGDQEGDGELLAESEDIVFECPPRDKFPILFECSVPIMANRWYVAWACINGPSSDCGSSGQAMVINDEVGFHFKTSKKSNNGTDVNAGQIPCLLYNTVTPDNSVPVRAHDQGEPVIVLTKNISRKVTVSCFRSLITLLHWSWSTFKGILLDTNGQVPINYQKLNTMKHQKRLVYVVRACLRLTKSYINEVYPQNHRKRNSHEYMSYFEAIADVRNLIQMILSEPAPTCAMLPKKPGKLKAIRLCYVQFALEMTNSILKECHETFTSCFHAFFPTPTLKWNQLCSMLYFVKELQPIPGKHTRELTSTCASLCISRSLRDVLQYVVPLTQTSILLRESRRPDSKVLVKTEGSKSATVPRTSHPKPPPVPPRACNKDGQQKNQDPPDTKTSYMEWHLLDVIPRLLDIVMSPVKQQMMTRQCGQPHDHGEVKLQERLSKFCCRLISRIVAELAYGVTNIRDDMDTSNSFKPLVTPSRFMRVNQARAWNTGNGSPDAICFTVDRSGVMLAGVCVYGGLGTYEYELELLHDVRQIHAGTDEGNLSHCWVSVEVTHGSFNTADSQRDELQIKFDRPVPLKEELRYAIRFCNHGGRTVNGDCGLPSVKGPDGTTFRFASCSLSFNGTSLARGQIPALIYFGYGTSKPLTGTSDNTDTMLSALRAITLRVASVVMSRSADLFCSLRNELTAEELRRSASVLQLAPAVNTLIPLTLSSLESLNDSRSVVQILEMIQALLPHVSAVNLLVPSNEEPAPATTPHYYTWVESEHPYKQAAVSNMRVLFPPSVSWIVLEMDPRSITAQPEDSLTIFAAAGPPRQRCHCAADARLLKPPFKKRYIQLTNEATELEPTSEEPSEELLCLHYNCTYVAVTNKLANVAAEWPQKAILVPGNEVVFSLETASDYLNEYNKNSDENRFGFRCLCVGYEDAAFTTLRQGLVALEMELAYAGAACASKLLAPDIDIPTLTQATVLDVQTCIPSGSSPTNGEGETDTSEALMLSRGLELSSPPSIHHVLDGQPLLRSISTERQFLSDFVSGLESTAGGRLAWWLSPAPRVEPAHCELRPPSTPARPAARLTLPVLLRDQYGDPVASNALTVEVVVQKLEEGGGRRSRVSLSEAKRSSALPDAAYQPTARDTMRFHAITMMKAYQGYSFEELRHLSGAWGGLGPASGAGRVPAERLPVRAHPDGSYAACWTPRAPGMYTLRCTLDELPVSQELTIEVAEGVDEGPSERVPLSGIAPPSPPAKLRRFAAPYSAGLRVRASPSLQAEELGVVPHGSIVAFVEEVVNKDGTWVRLSADSMQAFADSTAAVAWCLQYHRQLDRALLQLTSPHQTEYPDSWPGYSAMHNWPGEGDAAAAASSAEPVKEIVEEKRVPFFVKNDSAENESDGSSGPEPSKRGRLARDEAAIASPRRLQRRSNGNGGNDEWWTSEKFLSSENLKGVNIPAEVDQRISSRLTQTGTQTSPDSQQEEAAAAQAVLAVSNKDGPSSPRTVARERLRSRGFKRGASPPPPPARAPAVRKQALSPAQAECLRAIFAALLWHEGIVHDAIACAAFLKFHPSLPKHGARVVTRAPHQPPPRPLRHSLEVNSSGQYLHIQPSTLETLTRSGVEASVSRLRKITCDTPPPIKEEESASQQGTMERPTTSVVNVLPPALRALVALWDALNNADQLAVATDKFRKEILTEKNENEPPSSSIRKKRDWKSIPGAKTPYSVCFANVPVECELCGGASVPPPLAAHMRHMHPGCRGRSSRGYDRSGAYVCAPPANAICGQLAQAYHLWYILCEQCRDKALKAAQSSKQSKSKPISDQGSEKIEPQVEVDHHVIKENAVFLLDLAPLTSSESPSLSPYADANRSPPAATSSPWQPAPPFQSLQALGAAPRLPPPHSKYHSLGRAPPTNLHNQVFGTSEQLSSLGPVPRVHRSVSMGGSGAQELVLTDHRPLDPLDPLAGGGSSLLAQPSAALQRLVGGVDWTEGTRSVSAFEPPRLDAEELMRRPTLAFVLARRDLHAYRQKMDAAVRINTVRQYAFEAMNWLLRSVTQPTCVHDVMWWFCNALDKFARIVPIIPADDNKENVADLHRCTVPTATASALCPGGRAARLARSAFHSFLGSVSTLAPSLPAAGAAALQAVRCWALHYTQHDRAFLHRSQVFSVISRILSHSEDGVYEEGALGPIRENAASFHNKENYVWVCPDVTGWCDVTVSSRQGMAGALTDGSTETFWESGDEDRNKAKWIQVAYPGGTMDDRPHIICLHIDNTRDTVNKTLMVSFLYSGASADMFHMQDMDVDAKNAAWLCYSLPRVSCSPLRVRCELRGPEPGVRVRGVRVLSAPAAAAPAPPPAVLLHGLTECDTLRVFRLLTSQVFGKLLEWEAGDSDAGDAAADEPGSDSDLREHVVGILFAGHQLTCLQRQVMSHIVCAIGCEAARARDDWETALVCEAGDQGAGAGERGAGEGAGAGAGAGRGNAHVQDSYCFEMLSLLLALSGSAVGRAHLAQRTELLADLLSLLHTGSERVQRQVISLLRRMIAEIPPQKMLAAINYGSDMATRVTLLDHLVSYLSKAITVQLKVKAFGAPPPSSITMGGSVAPAPPAAWFMRGSTTNKHAHLVAKLLCDMAEDKVSPTWTAETVTSLTSYVTRLATLSEAERAAARCVAAPAMWLALAALCVCQQSQLDSMNATEGRDRREAADRPYCANHDDGATVAVVDCRSCGALCAECDRFLHMRRAARSHHRQICKEEESAIRIDIHEGCGRAKLFWLLLLVDRRTLKALAEFRVEGHEGVPGVDTFVDMKGGLAAGLAGTCRFCGARGSSGLLAIGNVCADQQCQDHGKESCARVLSCGHLCGGVRGEKTCLPCLFGCTAAVAGEAPLRQDADDMCMICFTDPLQAAPAIQLKCGHVFHLHCCKNVLESKWNGPRITFSFSQCPICKEDMNHWTLEDQLAPIRRLKAEVRRKALMRLQYEGAAPTTRSLDPAAVAMERYAYYACHKCGKAYFGGLARCEAESSGWWEPGELVCGACSDVAGARSCAKHKQDFLEYKCRYCCSVAVFFCFGTSHFCNACHDDFQRVTNIPKHLLPHCPAGPKGEQLPGTSEECPLHVEHPATGEEFALGCGVCRHAQTF
ncbi:E3 ubiquitin-protein ligase MYCBP2 [Plutella xylostella]|uniref:E3 ubiquitin-protein ligase MYCBP2 n=1 Tax=Plutella xylostella TaxID=51655 RepID=UPI002032E653|nr:E3 ubiquitin-protein ligase MYCBP2 [Plutella xylostella]